MLSLTPFAPFAPFFEASFCVVQYITMNKHQVHIFHHFSSPHENGRDGENNENWIESEKRQRENHANKHAVYECL